MQAVFDILNIMVLWLIIKRMKMGVTCINLNYNINNDLILEKITLAYSVTCSMMIWSICVQRWLLHDDIMTLFRCLLSAILYFSLCSILGSVARSFLLQITKCCRTRATIIYLQIYYWNNTENVSLIMVLYILNVLSFTN